MLALRVGLRISKPQLRAPLLVPSRSMALSRYPSNGRGGRRFRADRERPLVERAINPTPTEPPLDTSPAPRLPQNSYLWDTPHVEAQHGHEIGRAEESLRRLLSNDVLVVSRQIEMMNIFLGFEQANRYATDEFGNLLGYIAEQERSFLGTVARQVFRLHRPFRALVMDPEGIPILWLRRPFAWINSRMFIQRRKDEVDESGEPSLETFAEVQQRWHLWRRRYDLFLRDEMTVPSHAPLSPPISLPTDVTSRSDEHATFSQSAVVDAGFWAWHFVLQDARREEIASVGRGFGGWGRELFTDTGRYTIRFTPAPPDPEAPVEAHQKQQIVRRLTFDERASILALSVNIDFDYFSRHSEGRGLGISPWFLFGGGSDD